MTEFDIDFLAEYSDDSVLEELKRIAKLCGSDSVSKSDIESFGRVSYSLINKRFGSLRQALQQAGLKPARFMNATDDEMLAILVELWEKVLEKEGRTPQRKDLKAYNSPISGGSYARRFGSWKKALAQAYNSVTEEGAQETQREAVVAKTKKARKALSLSKRFYVLKRDEFTCRACGACGQGTRLEVDHIVPFSRGGSDELSNLQTLCFKCRGKRDTV